MAQDDDLVMIEAGGRVRPIGESAAVRFQAREGMFHVLPSPPHLLVLREAVTPGGSADPRACRLSGQLTTPGALSDILGLCATAAWTGELMVFDKAGARSLYVEEGTVVGGATTVASERLGQVLYRYGVLTLGQVDACLVHAVATARFGEAAVKLGLVKREKLFEMLARQIEEIVRGALLVEDGYFYFLDSFDASVLAARHAIPLSALVRDGIRWLHEARHLRGRIPSMDHVPIALGPPPRHDAEQARLHGAIDGARSVGEIARLLGIGELDVMRTLFPLVHHGLVVMQPPRVPPEKAVVACNDAVSLILRELDAMDLGDEIRTQLAERACTPPYAQLFAGAGPHDDGTFTPNTVVANLPSSGIASQEDLSRLLREYAGYALFLARPHLQRARLAKEGGGPRLSHRVAQLLEPIRADDRPPADGAPGSRR
jgi:hypothetical protein